MMADLRRGQSTARINQRHRHFGRAPMREHLNQRAGCPVCGPALAEDGANNTDPRFVAHVSVLIYGVKITVSLASG
jgi:hypothetical protein